MAIKVEFYDKNTKKAQNDSSNQIDKESETLKKYS